MITKYVDFVNEVIGSEDRCTNLVLRSFGICADEPVMNMIMLYRHLYKMYDDVLEYTPFPTFEYPELEILDGGKRKEGKNIIAPLNSEHIYSYLDGIFVKRTVRSFVHTIYDLNAYGHYILGLRAHVMAVHYTDDGLYLVDAEEKFMSRRSINKVLIINEKEAGVNFEYYLGSENLNQNKIQRL